MESKLFLGLGILTILSGIGLVASSQYIIGVSGSIIGLWLTMDNLKKIRMNNKK